MTETTTFRWTDSSKGFLRGLMALVAITLVGTSAEAQQSRVGNGSARLDLRASLSMGYAMRVRQTQPARIVQSTATSTDVELPVTAAANANWTLSMSNFTTAPGKIQILDASGTWRELSEGGTADVYTGGQPTNGQPVTVRLRLAPGATLDALNGLRLMMSPSEL